MANGPWENSGQTAVLKHQRVAQLTRPDLPVYPTAVIHPSARNLGRRNSSSSIENTSFGSDLQDSELLASPYPEDWEFEDKTEDGKRGRKKKSRRGADTSMDTEEDTFNDITVTRNNAITVAPSRLSTYEPNVFQTYHKGRRHKPRSRTPDPGGKNKVAPPDLDQMLSKLDKRIRNNFGDWTTMDDDKYFEARSRGNPYGKTKPEVIDNTDKALPQLYKNYHAVLKSSKGRLLDRNKMPAYSRDNLDPDSILSQAKRTLTQMDHKR